MWSCSKTTMVLVGFAAVCTVRAAEPTITDLARQAQERAAQRTPDIHVEAADDQTTKKAAQAASQAIEAGGKHSKNITLPTKAQDQAKMERLALQAQARGATELKKQAQAEVTRRGDSVRADPQGPVQGLLVLALSSSMPEKMVHDYMAQLDGIPGTVIVLRGFIGGATSVKPTGQWVERMRRKQLSRIDAGHYRVDVKVDPLLYRDLNIDRVPAVAYLPGVLELQHCDAQALSSAVVVYGASTVASALREMQSRGVDVPTELANQLGGA